MFVFVVVIVAASISSGLGRQLDSTKCHMNDPELSNCVLKTLNSLTPKVETEGSKPPTPFLVPMFHIVHQSDSVNYTATCQNLSIRGMNKFDVKEVSFDPKSMAFDGRVEYGTLLMACDYTFQGQLVMIPVSGEGVIHVELGPIHAKLGVDGEMKESSPAFYNPKTIKLRMVIDDISVNFEGLFAGNGELERMTNQALNTNSKLLVDAITPALEKIGEKVFLQPLKSLSKRILYK